jgi:hypothetical protein
MLAETVFPTVEAMDLQADEAARVTAIRIFVDQILDQLTIDPRSDARPFRNDA